MKSSLISLLILLLCASAIIGCATPAAPTTPTSPTTPVTPSIPTTPTRPTTPTIPTIPTPPPAPQENDRKNNTKVNDNYIDSLFYSGKLFNDINCIVGKALFIDVSPAIGSIVYIFRKPDNSLRVGDGVNLEPSLGSFNVGSSGYYKFINLDPGEYQIQIESYHRERRFFSQEDATEVTLIKDELCIAPDLKVLRNIDIFADNVTDTSTLLTGEREYYVGVKNPRFYWNTVPEANYYELCLLCVFVYGYDKSFDGYKETKKVSDTSIVWITELPEGEYHIEAKAYSNNGDSLAVGERYFYIGAKPG